MQHAVRSTSQSRFRHPRLSSIPSVLLRPTAHYNVGARRLTTSFLTNSVDRVTISVLDLFTIGIGPSSSHAVGPMRAAARFLGELREHSQLDRVARLRIYLYGSLGATGRGHGTDRAVLLGLEGDTPEDVEPATMSARLEAIRQRKQIVLSGSHPVPFQPDSDLVFLPQERLPRHPNALRFQARDRQ